MPNTKKAPVAKTKDEIVLELQELVKQKKAQIAKINKPDYITPMSFKETNSSMAINLHVTSDLNVLVGIVATLNSREEAMNAAAQEMGIDNFVYKHDGFTAKQWKHDIQYRILKINIAGEKAKLEAYEERLAKLESPELKEKRELEELQALLSL